MEYKTSVNLAGVELKNPVMTASGTFGSAGEYGEFYDLGELGAVVTKGVANVPWPGNPTPRIAETKSGMLNAIGLQNPGLDVFLERDLPKLKKYDTKIIVNVCGKTTEDYCDAVERLSDADVDMLEINVSCPNVKEGGIAFGQKPEALEAIADKAIERNIGARGLRAVMEGILTPMMYDIPSDPTVVKAVITKDCVEGRSGPELTHDPKKINYSVKLNTGKGEGRPASGSSTPASAS